MALKRPLICRTLSLQPALSNTLPSNVAPALSERPISASPTAAQAEVQRPCTSQGPPICCLTADIDNDGIPEVLVGTADGRLVVLKRNDEKLRIAICAEGIGTIVSIAIAHGLPEAPALQRGTLSQLTSTALTSSLSTSPETVPASSDNRIKLAKEKVTPPSLNIDEEKSNIEDVQQPVEGKFDMSESPNPAGDRQILLCINAEGTLFVFDIALSLSRLSDANSSDNAQLRPLFLAAAVENASAMTVGDIDEDGYDEVIIGTADGCVCGFSLVMGHEASDTLVTLQEKYVWRVEGAVTSLDVIGIRGDGDGIASSSNRKLIVGQTGRRPIQILNIDAAVWSATSDNLNNSTSIQSTGTSLKDLMDLGENLDSAWDDPMGQGAAFAYGVLRAPDDVVVLVLSPGEEELFLLDSNERVILSISLGFETIWARPSVDRRLVYFGNDDGVVVVNSEGYCLKLMLPKNLCGGICCGAATADSEIVLGTADGAIHIFEKIEDLPALLPSQKDPVVAVSPLMRRVLQELQDHEQSYQERQLHRSENASNVLLRVPPLLRKILLNSSSLRSVATSVQHSVTSTVQYSQFTA